MSSKAMTWAWQQIGTVKGSTHHLLLAIAENANWETGLAYPSIACLIEMTGQDRKTILAGIGRILDARLMKDTGNRTGLTKQIPVYRLAPWVREWSENQTMGKTGLFDSEPAKGPGFPSEESRISGEESRKRDTEPSIGTKEGSFPPSPDGEGVPHDNLFGETLPGKPAPPELEVLVRTSWAALKQQYPGIADIDVLSESRIKKIHARAAEAVRGRRRDKREATPESIWAEIFEHIPKSDFLCGRLPPGKGRTTPFKLGIDYVLRPSEFFRILGGEYDDGEQSGPGRTFDAGSGRRYGSTEAAARRAIERHVPARQRRTG